MMRTEAAEQGQQNKALHLASAEVAGNATVASAAPILGLLH
jgi:hypothetical protein